MKKRNTNTSRLPSMASHRVSVPNFIERVITKTGSKLDRIHTIELLKLYRAETSCRMSVDTFGRLAPKWYRKETRSIRIDKKLLKGIQGYTLKT
jgi:hypothetical protein